MAIYKLRDLFEITGGSTPSTKQKDLWDGNVLWYTPIDLNINKHTMRKIKQSIKTLPKGSVMISSRAPIGYINVSAEECWHSQGVKGFKNKDESLIKNKYFKYLLKTQINYLRNAGAGSTFKEISKHYLENFEVDIPEIEEQNKIIDIIEPIEILEMNLELVNSKLNLLIKNLELKNQRVKIKDISKLIRYKEQGIKQISAKKLNTSNPIIIEDEPIGTYKTNSFHCPKGTLVINTIRTYLRKFGILDNDLDANGTLIQLIIDKEFETTILSSLLNDDFWNETILLSQGTKMPVIKKSDLLNIEIPLVKNEIEGIFKLYISISLMKRKLSQMKKSLIQILIK